MLLGTSGLSDLGSKKKHVHPAEESIPSFPNNFLTVICHYLGFIISYMMWTTVALSAHVWCGKRFDLVKNDVNSSYLYGVIICILNNSVFYTEQSLMLPKKILGMHISRGDSKFQMQITEVIDIQWNLDVQTEFVLERSF